MRSKYTKCETRLLVQKISWFLNKPVKLNSTSNKNCNKNGWLSILKYKILSIFYYFRAYIFEMNFIRESEFLSKVYNIPYIIRYMFFWLRKHFLLFIKSMISWKLKLQKIQWKHLSIRIMRLSTVSWKDCVKFISCYKIHLSLKILHIL